MEDSVRYETGVWIGSLHITAPTPPVEALARAPRARDARRPHRDVWSRQDRLFSPHHHHARARVTGRAAAAAPRCAEGSDELLKTHPSIIYFLTMLVGAGGNAGNQSSVRVIRGLAIGTVTAATRTAFVAREVRERERDGVTRHTQCSEPRRGGTVDGTAFVAREV